MTEPIKSKVSIQRYVCESCFLVFEATAKKTHCAFCEKNQVLLAAFPVARLDRMIDIMPKASIAGLPTIIKLLWEEMQPLIKVNHDRS